MKKLFSLFFVLLFTASSFGWAESAVSSGSICPVSGEKASGKITHAYQGKTYSFCCPKCLKEFKNHPEKYVNLNPESVGEHHHH